MENSYVSLDRFIIPQLAEKCFFQWNNWNKVTINNPKLLKGDQTGTRVFTYDSAYDDGAKQEDLYEENFRSLVNSVLNGFNGTIFAYGQTGTGKTFTMEGVRTDENLKGVIPRSFDHIFTHISRTTDEQYLGTNTFELDIQKLDTNWRMI